MSDGSLSGERQWNTQQHRSVCCCGTVVFVVVVVEHIVFRFDANGHTRVYVCVCLWCVWTARHRAVLRMIFYYFIVEGCWLQGIKKGGPTETDRPVLAPSYLFIVSSSTGPRRLLAGR